MRLSVIVPTLNEAAGIAAALQALQPLRQRGHVVVVVDGGSTDATAALAAPLADRLLNGTRGRAAQMNAGAATAASTTANAATPDTSQADVLLFLHADTALPPQADALVAAAMARGALWGRFDVRITGRSPLLRVVAALMNLRSRLTGIATGDQAIFVRQRVFQQLGGYAALPLMEDIELSRRLRRVAAPACLRARVATSGRRWETRGVWRTIWLMWRLRWRYWRGTPAEQLAQDYR